uniref:Bromodomain adjacent to zinc finger domain, 2A n=1 Tax=Astyanax mexicanus TaxID=7994 RepID=A0A8B9HC04_ASTMX
METNNRFNYGTHAVSTNSGMKRSSGDSLYTNGSSMSFPQQGKNLNGDMNVNGITTADGASQSGPHPPSSSYTHMSGHQRQDAVSYDYLWGQSQYNPAMSSGTGSGSGSASGHGMHQKPGSQGVMQQQQPQHHFQGHGQYQVNGSIGGSRQPPLAGAQYWGRGNPGQQHEGSAMPIGYNSHGIYGSYPNQVHSGLPQASHHQQPPPIQHQSAAALHHHPHHPQHQQPQHLQPPQQQHYGMVPNGIPYYSHQPQHAPLSSQQPQTPMMPTTQNFTPPQGSPQHHPIGHGGTSSPLSVQVPRMSPSAVSDSVHMSESYKEVDEGYNGVERAPVPQRLSVGEGFTVKPPETLLPPSNDYIPRLQQPVVHAEPAKHHDLGNLHKELSPPPISAALPQTVLGPTAKQSLYSSAASESASGVSAHASVVLKAGVNTSSAVAAPPPQLLTTPPLLVQGLRPVAAPVPPASASVPAALSASSATASPQMGQNCSKATPPAVSAPPSVISRSQFVAGPQSVDSPGTRGLQVPQSSISQHAPPKISTPSCAPEPPHKAMTSHLVAPSPASPLASLAPTTVDHFSLTVDSKLRSVISAPPLASETTLSQSHSSPQQSAARLPDASSTPQAFPPAPPPSSSALKSSVSSTESQVSKQECHAAFWTEPLVKSSVSSPIITVAKQPDMDVKKSPETREDHQAAPGKEKEETLNNTMDTENYPSLTESAYTDTSGAEDAESLDDSYDVSLNNTSQAEGSSMFTDGSWANESRGWFSQDKSRRQDTTADSYLTTRSSSDDTSLQDYSQMDYSSVNDSSQNQTSQLSSVNEFSIHFTKANMACVGFFPLHIYFFPLFFVFFAEGETPRRRIATEEQVNFPLLHGWRREIRVRMLEDRLKGETWYYSPCGRRMKQFPEVIKFLRRHQDNLNGVTREHFSFSPRMPVGDFYEERDTPEGKKWFLLANEEVPSMIMSITGRRGRPPNPDKEAKVRPRVGRPKGTPARRPGRPPKAKMIDLLSKIDARLLKRLEAKEELTEEEKQKLVKIKKKMKKKLEGTQPTDAEMDQSVPQPPKKPGRRRKVPVPPPVEVDLEKASPVKRAATARSKAKALAKAQAEAEAQARAALAAKRQAERRAQAQKRLEERKRQQQILEELKKPAEDMCLTDHTPLPELSRIPGLALSGVTFSHCVIVVEFLHSYGKVLGLQVPKDIPSLATLQKGLLDVGNSQKELLDLLVKLMEAVLIDPGLPPYYQSVKILGEKLVDLELTHNTVSEVLRIFLESHGFELEVCNTLRTKSFQTLCPEVKASILAFLVEELNASNTVIREVDNSLENMATYRKNKWIIEGKLRKLKAALLKKTGLSEEQLSYEDRRRSTRMGVAEEESLEENSRLKRGGRRRRRRPKEEPKLTEAESPNNATVPELERHIDKLTKRQVFFRKKLQQSSHSMRAMALGQDRYRRRYWLLPRIGCVLVEGAEDILASNDILVKDVPVTPVLKEVVSPVKVEVKEEPPVSAVSSDSNLSPEVDPLPGEASLMSSPRGRGRPRKIKPEVELHLRTAKCRRRRRSSKSGGEDSVTGAGPDARMPDLTQTAFQTWLSQNQGSASAEAPALLSGAGQGGDGSQPEDGMKDMAEIRGQWFNLLPKDPCDESSLSQPCRCTCVPAFSPVSLTKPPAGIDLALCYRLFFQAVIPSPQVCSTPAPRPGRRRRRGSGAGRGHSRVGTAKRRGRPPSSLLQEIEQKYFTQLVVKPIPLAMVKGWWWIKDPEELTAILTALNPRGVREKVLHKHLSKHMEFLSELCTRPITDPIFQQKGEDGGNLMNLTQQPWEAQDRAMQIDLSVLQLVEDLEQRVVGADLQLKMAPPNGQSDTESAADASTAGFQMYTIPEPDSTRDDLQYYEHEADPRDDWMVKIKKEWSDLLRVPSNPLDLGVLRLTNLERNIERRYLKDPLWNLSEVVRLAPLTPPPGEEEVPMDAVSMESEITPRLMLWRQALDRCRSASQLALCLLQLERAIAWEKSIVRVTCQFCRKGDNDECLLLCDGCDRGWHMFCLKPKVTEVPEGDWFCPNCIAKGIGEGPRSPRSARQRTNARKRRFVYGAEASDEEEGQKRNTSTRQKDSPTPSSATSQSLSKRRRMATRNQPDLTYCEIILMEMEAHADAWPFLEPVNPRLVPGYRRIVKNPMDFLTMREKLLQGGYCSCEEFAADAQLVFNNCELFNEDSSEVGVAGHSMRRFFESRWAEFYSNGD